MNSSCFYFLLFIPSFPAFAFSWMSSTRHVCCSSSTVLCGLIRSVPPRLQSGKHQLPHQAFRFPHQRQTQALLHHSDCPLLSSKISSGPSKQEQVSRLTLSVCLFVLHIFLTLRFPGSERFFVLFVFPVFLSSLSVHVCLRVCFCRSSSCFSFFLFLLLP